MKSEYFRIGALVSTGVIVTGLVWLLVYSLRFHEGIGFDGPAGGILGLSLIGGWLLSSIATLIWFKHRAHQSIIIPIVLVIIVGAVMALAVGYAVSSYAINRYPDGGKHFVN